MIEGYKLIETDKMQIYVDEKTGEAVGVVQPPLLPEGSSWQTPKQRQESRNRFLNYQKYMEGLLNNKEYIEQRKQTEKDLGSFYFLLADKEIFSDLSPQSAARMIMLCTYLKGNKFIKRGNTPLLKSDFREKLGLSKDVVNKFYNEIIDKYIIELNDGLYIKDSKIAFRGKLQKTKTRFQQFQKIYINTVRELYNNTPPKKHKQLGYVFKLLPYVNLQFNILCVNPFEFDLNLVEPLTMEELSELIPYDITQMSRLIKDLKALKFYYKDRLEYLISYVNNGDSDVSKQRIFLNPNIVYNGNDYKRVEVLGLFCKEKSQNQ